MTLIYLLVIVALIALFIAAVLLRKYPVAADPLFTIFYCLEISVMVLLILGVFFGLETPLPLKGNAFHWPWKR